MIFLAQMSYVLQTNTFHLHGKQNDRAASLLFDLRAVKKRYFKAINLFRFQHQKIYVFYFFDY